MGPPVRLARETRKRSVARSCVVVASAMHSLPRATRSSMLLPYEDMTHRWMTPWVTDSPTLARFSRRAVTCAVLTIGILRATLI